MVSSPAKGSKAKSTKKVATKSAKPVAKKVATKPITQKATVKKAVPQAKSAKVKSSPAKASASKSNTKTSKTTAKAAPAKKVASAKKKTPAKSPTKSLEKNTKAKATTKASAVKTKITPIHKNEARSPLKKVVETGKKRPSNQPLSSQSIMQTEIKSQNKKPPAAPLPSKHSIASHKKASETPTVSPYIVNEGESYMSEEQLNHFLELLTVWKHALMEEVDRTMDHMKEAGNLPDPNDRASQEEGFTLELRARDRERKLIKKIEEAIERIENNQYGYCEECGVEIGIRRLEARPTATLCIDCKTLDEIKEKQMNGN